ncbi:uncharacterized protein SPAPADRAFT_65435 [Spathaspora passalidarum NRRL Y-27907]|uniref:candidapepsin n=1 Tax=Spathaspora passalidarum (strain NRRL Y-27907 / 11-Y1) TaxID=619300 RepID=G3AHW6_SPAPN|nr:uncharacterized protein SPAPADRAFT_65435 [Spathaspora passalidarum NRRL Y-27907]EGW34280.1 hypothetical protein SPAPADRAFT_65435 [Spathaspora passalidarum NRRL Y-27907]
MFYQLLILYYLLAIVLTSPLKLDIEVHRRDEIILPHPYLRKRDEFRVPVSSEYSVYTTILRIGSNRDPVRVILDTGSSDLWVMSSNVSCVSNEQSKEQKTGFFDSILTALNLKATRVCTDNGAFDYLNSATFTRNDTNPFSIGYIDGVTTKGFWGYDDITIGGNPISNLSFAVAEETSSKIGVLGIGLPEAVSTNTKYDKSYENLPLKMKNLGLINRTSYSVYMNSNEARYGAILFGAIDHAKYSGNLTTLDIVNPPSSLQRLRIPISSIQIANGTNSPTTAVSKGPSALLDTGCTYSRFSKDVVDSIAKQVGATFSKDKNQYIIDCNIPATTLLRLNFNGQPIDIPMTEMIRSAGTNTCTLGIDVDESNSLSIVGDNILRRMYVYFDLEGKQISVAQAVYTDEQNIEIISDDNFQTDGQEAGSELVQEEEKNTSSASNILFSWSFLISALSVFFIYNI